MMSPAALTYRHALREARIVLCVWFLALVWTVGYCYLHGYRHDADCWLVQNGIAETVPAALSQTRFGMPMWVCWGIFAPAVCCTVFTFLFGLFGMPDDPLGVEGLSEGESEGGQS